ncbi:MAG: NADP-specific glutamate dehydrogenase [Alphaproteobacteria bacterium]|jgi:glutamate dehydrogenase (NADP+)|nr:NADP-specific glutamate dehydrogenase [Alphaproteobacteria bacterium]MBT5828281.1 NADP-specific glutamate dehydrogenase [Alphaproteobacteria bacterium]
MLNNQNSLSKYLEAHHAGQIEFHQAVENFYQDIAEIYNDNLNYQQENILARLIESDRIISFRVNWRDDNGIVRVNRGYRVQQNNALGPYKGGLRFDPSVNLSILKFLAFEQIFKNSLTNLPLGGGKGGLDIDPKNLSFAEKERICQAYMQELHKYIGENRDIPAGDIGVSATEVGLLYGQYKKNTNQVTGSLTGKPLLFGGSLVRTEATGYGCIYFLKNILEAHDLELKNQNITISGAGNVAIFAAEKAIMEGATVLTLSDSKGMLYCKHGLTLAELNSYKAARAKGKRLADFCLDNKNCAYVEKQKPWVIECDVAVPCATQNELNLADAKILAKNGLKAVSPGANMPLTSEAATYLSNNQVIVAPAKAANAGGVAVSGLEMSQNAQHLSWEFDEIDQKLKNIMSNIHAGCIANIKRENGIYPYKKGANIAAFIKVADATIAQGS